MGRHLGCMVRMKERAVGLTIQQGTIVSQGGGVHPEPKALSIKLRLGTRRSRQWRRSPVRKPAVHQLLQQILNMGLRRRTATWRIPALVQLCKKFLCKNSAE